MFVRVPKEIIRYSISKNKLILPVYLYSGIRANQYNNYVVDTNILHIVETFNPHEDKRKGYNSKYIDTIQTLARGVEGEFSGCIQLKCNQEFKDGNAYAEFYNKLVDGINKNDRLEYYFLNREINMINKFTIIDSDEYFHLLNSITEINFNIMNNTDSQVTNSQVTNSQIVESEFIESQFNKKWNLVDLINLYVYLKMQIEFFAMLSKEKGTQIGMKESIETIANKMGVGTKTISKYINELVKLNMITLNTYQSGHKKVVEYILSNSWRADYE